MVAGKGKKVLKKLWFSVKVLYLQFELCVLTIGNERITVVN